METQNSFLNKFKSRLSRSETHSTLRWTFLTAGAIFLLVCLIGLSTRAIVDATGVLSAVMQGRTRFDFNTYSNVSIQPLYNALVVSCVLLAISAVSSFFWAYRAHTASRSFIIFNYVIYVVAQGIGFGILFMVFNSIELVSIFGIAGGVLGIMGAIGFLIKDGTRLRPYFIAGLGLSLLISIIAIALYFAGVYNNVLLLVLLSVSGFVTCLMLVFDIYYIKQSAQFQTLSSASDPDANFRFIAWWAFRLASDFIMLIWLAARIMLIIGRK